MDSERLKLEEDDVEMNKLIDLSQLLHMIRSLVIHSKSHDDLYEDVKGLVYFVDTQVLPKLHIPISNIIEFYKRSLYVMLKFAGEDFIRAADAQNKEAHCCSDEILTTGNQLDELKSAHDRLSEVIFDPTFSIWTDEKLMANINKDYCKILSLIVYNRSRDTMDDENVNKSKYQPCYFCHRDASVFGVGRLEGMCEENEPGGLVSETFTSFINMRYKNICCHYIGDMDKHKTSWDKLLAKQGDLA